MNNRIPILGQGGQESEVPLNLVMTHEPGRVMMTFDPPVVRMKLGPREARTLAMGLLQHADLCEYGKPLPQGPPPLMPPAQDGE